MKIQFHPVVKGILSVIAVTFIGFFLLNVAFLFDFLFQSVINAIVGLFTPLNYDMTLYWYPPLKHGLFVVLICIISWYVLRSKLGDVWKATYVVVPIATVLVKIGIFSSSLPSAIAPMVGISLGAIFTVGLLYYLYKTRQPWIFYYSTIAMAIVMLMVVIFGVEI